MRNMRSMRGGLGAAYGGWGPGGTPGPQPWVFMSPCLHVNPENTAIWIDLCS